MKRTKPRQLAQDALAHVVDTGTAWFSRIRWRALAWVLGIALAGGATVMMTGAWVPVVGAAVVAAAVSINRVAARLSKPVCYACGEDLSGRPMAHLGVLCPSCGSIHQPRPESGGPIGPDDDAGDDDTMA
ncbi:MAG: hypothetical protein JNK35_13275 [Phycisphaerae bacterium]|nr:hypothetical protein [Phycisphaerae bacterium]